jgi:hypothetical protein
VEIDRLNTKGEGLRHRKITDVVTEVKDSSTALRMVITTRKKGKEERVVVAGASQVPEHRSDLKVYLYIL